jgi:hypothetical protein
MTRILQKYKTDESRKYLIERQKSHDKENISEGYVQAIVKRLSREGTPDITGDSKLKVLSKHGAVYTGDTGDRCNDLCINFGEIIMVSL